MTAPFLRIGLTLAVLITAGWTSRDARGQPLGPASGGCASDGDCKGERVCVQATCVSRVDASAMPGACHADTECKGERVCDAGRCTSPSTVTHVPHPRVAPTTSVSSPPVAAPPVPAHATVVAVAAPPTEEEKQCRAGGNAQACNAAAAALLVDDPDRAMDLVVRACAADKARCNPGWTADILLVQGDGKRAVSLMARACDIAGDISACFMALDAYTYGAHGFASDPAAAVKLGERLCKDPSPLTAGPACQLLSTLYADGRGVTANSQVAAELSAKASRIEAAQRAFWLSNLAPGITALKLDLAENERKCSTGDARACSASGSVYADNNADLTKAEALYREGCRLDPTSCDLSSLGFRLLATTASRARAIEVMEAGCRISPRECSILGEIFLVGSYHLTRNRLKAATYFAKVCDAEGPAVHRLASCRKAASVFRDGRGVPVDLERAQALSARADTAEMEVYGPWWKDVQKSSAAAKMSAATAAMHAALDASPDAVEVARLKQVISAGKASTRASDEVREHSREAAGSGDFSGRVPRADPSLAVEAEHAIQRLPAIVAAVRRGGTPGANATTN